MDKLELEIAALSHSVTQSQSYAVVLKEVEGRRRLPIVIGIPEAQAIAVALENMKPTRPLTHDLMKNLCNEFQIQLQEVIISDLIDGIFHAKLICQQGNDVFEIDSRTSDALALAVRFTCPIYTYEYILDSAGIILEGEEGQTVETKEETHQKNQNSYKNHTLAKLQVMLSESIQKEDYESAARIRDEIEKRGTN